MGRSFICLFMAARGLLVVVSGGFSSLWGLLVAGGFSCGRARTLESGLSSFRLQPLEVRAQELWLMGSTACEILPDQGSNLRPLRWQADS